MTVHRRTLGLKVQQGRLNSGIREGFFPVVKIILDILAGECCGVSHGEGTNKPNRQTLPKMAKVSHQVLEGWTLK